MIEKIKNKTGTYCGQILPVYQYTTIDKINELVDAVNELQTKVNKMAPNINFAQPEVKENMQDKFAEQRRWIGRLCRFWNEDNEPILSLLKDVYTYFTDAPFVDVSNNLHWQHCEPVKPTDSIIYKGE